MIRAVLDTNVFVSALNFGGLPSQILHLLEEEAFTLYISQSIIDELRRVLREYFEWSDDDLTEALDQILSRAEMVEPSLEVISAVRDREDEHILACALGAKATVIVSGDNDLLV